MTERLFCSRPVPGSRPDVLVAARLDCAPKNASDGSPTATGVRGYLA